MADKLASATRIITAPPFGAFLLATILFFYDSMIFGSLLMYCAMVLFLTVLPTVAYPLQPFVPFFKGKGRKGQRDLAFVTSVIGYICGIVFAFLTGATKAVFIIYFAYFLSVAILALVNQVSRWKASGHACGAAGLVVGLVYFTNFKAMPMLLFFVAMSWASLRMKRHTVTELILGGLASLSAFVIVVTTAHFVAAAN